MNFYEKKEKQIDLQRKMWEPLIFLWLSFVLKSLRPKGEAVLC